MRRLRADWRRLALSVVAVGLGVALVVAVSLANSVVLQSFMDSIDELTSQVDLTISAVGGVPFGQDLAENISANIEGVKHAIPVVRAAAYATFGDSSEALTVHAFDLTDEESTRLYYPAEGNQPVIDDAIEFLNRLDVVILGRQFAESRGLEKGASLELTTPTGVKAFTVEGLIEPQGLAKGLQGRLVVMDLAAAERVFTTDGRVNQIDVVVREADEAGVVKRRIQEYLGTGFLVTDPDLQKDFIRRVVSGFQSMITAFFLMSLLAGFVICYSRLAAVFRGRTWEVGLLRAVGLRRRVVFWELLKEGFLLGVVGSAIGVGLGNLIASRLLPVLAQTTAIALRLPEPSADLKTRYGAVLLGTLIGMTASLGAAALPALRLAFAEPVAALTMRGRELPMSTARVRWSPLLGLLSVIAMLIVGQHLFSVVTLGHVTTGLLALTTCLAASPVVHRGAYVVRGLWSRFFGPVGRLAAEQVGLRGGQASLTVATLAVGLGTTLVVGTLAWSLERTLLTTLSERIRTSLVVTSSYASRGYLPAPVNQILLEALRPLTGVKAVIGQQYLDVLFRNQDALLITYDASCLTDTELCDWGLPPGTQTLNLANGSSVLVSTSFARQFGVSVGDSITLDSPAGPAKFRVDGVTNGQPERAVVMSRERYRDLWTDPLVTFVFVQTEGGQDPLEVSARIQEDLGDKYQILVHTKREMTEFFASQAPKAFRVHYVLDAVILAIILVGIGDTLATSVLERTHELGMMRAVGLSRSRLFSLILLEGAALGVLGLALALATSFVLGLFWIQVQFPAIVGIDLDLHVDASLILGAVVVTLVSCLVGSFLPALRAARLTVAEAIRNE